MRHTRLIAISKDMSDSYGEPQNNFKRNEGNREPSGRGRSQGGRDSGGFRIRLSDNEMRSARALQEAFNLRSTVAVLGFAVRTLGQMLENGQLSELIEEQKSQIDTQNDLNQRGSRSRPNENMRQQEKSPKPNPFARPTKPQPKEEQQEGLEIPEKIPGDEEKEKQSQDEANSSQNEIEKESDENKSISVDEA